MITVSTFGYTRHQVDIPKKYNLVHNMQSNCDIAFIQDPAIIQYMNGELNFPDSTKIVLRMYEWRNLWDQESVYSAIINNKDRRVDMLLTWVPELLELPNAVPCFVTDASQWYGLTEEAFQIYPKSKLLSIISSNKVMVPGHHLRLQFVDSIRDKGDLYGRGFNEIDTKLDGLKDYMFSVAIENCTPTNGLSEKIVDCFRAGTVPVYYGPDNIGDFFDMRGILQFKTMEELHNIIDSLTPELYESMLEGVKENFERAKNYTAFNDSLYDLYFKQLI